MRVCLQIVQQLLKSGNVLPAFSKTEAGLEAVPGDPRLLQLRDDCIHATDEVCYRPRPSTRLLLAKTFVWLHLMQCVNTRMHDNTSPPCPQHGFTPLVVAFKALLGASRGNEESDVTLSIGKEQREGCTHDTDEVCYRPSPSTRRLLAKIFVWLHLTNA